MCSFQFAWFSVRTFMVAENWCLTLPCRSGQTYRRQVTQLSLLPLPLWMAVGFVFHSNFVLRKCLAHAMFLYAIPINYTSFSSETLVCLMLRSAVHDCDTIFKQLAALLATLNATEIDDVNHLSKLCAKNVLPLSCAELLKIDPYPTIHPFMRILWVS